MHTKITAIRTMDKLSYYVSYVRFNFPIPSFPVSASPPFIQIKVINGISYLLLAVSPFPVTKEFINIKKIRKKEVQDYCRDLINYNQGRNFLILNSE